MDDFTVMRNMRILRTLVLLILALIPLAQTQGQNTLNVPSTTYPTIQSAINAAVTGDTVQVAPGTYFENVVIAGPSIQVVGAGPGLSIIDGGGVGSCLKFSGASTTVAVVEEFTLQNGRGEVISPWAPTNLQGGGILVASATSNPVQTIRNCEIVNCSGSDGSAVAVSQVHQTFLEDVEIHSCSVGATANGVPNSVISTDGGNVQLSLKRCKIHNNTAENIIVSASSMMMDGCQVEMNTALTSSVVVSQNDFPSIRRTKIVNNVTSNAGVIVQVIGHEIDFGDCLIANNIGGAAVVSFGSAIAGEASNLTIVNNQLGANPIGVIHTDAWAGMANIISWGNTNSGGATTPAHSSFSGGYIGTTRNSIIENGTGLGTTVQSVSPNFVDSSTGDFRLLPGSPGIDTGTSAVTTLYYPTFPTEDIDGQPRIRGTDVDMGCYEAQSIASSPVSAGRVGENQGGPFDILLINGSNGGPFRTVSVPIGSASVIQMIQPPSSAAPLDFSIFGLIGEATYDTIWNVPFGIGDMGFAPAPAAPLFQPILFTYASSVGAINGVLPLIPGSPTPWSAGSGPAIPFPLTLTFQAVVADANGVFTPTNLIIFKVE